jgi:hypothetical protein
MFVTLEIPPSPFHAKKLDDSLVNVIIILHSSVPCQLGMGTIYVDNAADFPPTPVLTETLSETFDDLPVNLPNMRRHASDGVAHFSPESKKDKIVEYSSMNPVKKINDLYLFHLQFPSLVFDGSHHFEGTFTIPETQERTRFTLQLPIGYHDGLGHIVLGSLQSFSNLPSIPCYFNDLLLSLNYLLNILYVQRLPLQQKTWLGNSLVGHVWSQMVTRHESTGAMLLEILKTLSSSINQNKFCHGDFGVILLGQLLDRSPSFDISLGSDCDALYSAPLRLLSSGLEIFQKPSKNQTAQPNSGMDSPTFATFRYVRIALNFLLNQDLNNHIPSYQSCRVVIPLLATYQQLFPTQASQKRVFRYGSRDSWGFLAQLDLIQQSLNSFEQKILEFFRGNILPSNLLQTRDILDNETERDGESQIFADLISTMTTLIESQGSFLAETPALVELIPWNERNGTVLYREIIPSFDALISSRKTMHNSVNRYLRLLNKIHQTDSAHIPSFRRVWSYQEFKYLSAKGQQISRPPLDGVESKIGEESIESNPNSLGFVTAWAGSGSKGRPDDVSSERSLLTTVSFNNPGCLAVRTDSSGNPCYSAGIDEQQGLVYLSDTLNHSIRVLAKPRHGCTLIGNSTGSSGSVVGKLTNASLNSPRGICTHDVYDHSGMRKTLLVIADSMNNSLKGVVIEKTHTTASQGQKSMLTLPDHELFPIVQSTLPNPTGVCSWNGVLYVCCRSDHTLRCVSLRKKVISSPACSSLPLIDLNKLP